MKDDNKQTRRRFLKATGGAATAVALAGCLGGGGDDGGNGGGSGGGNGGGGGNGSGGGNGGGGGQQTQQNVQGDPSKKLQLINSTITTLDPVASTDTAGGVVIQQMFDALMNYPNGEAAVEKQLAKSYTLSDDQTTYTFKLKQGAKFHNGKTVTADDFVYAFERLAGSENSARSYFILDSLGVQAQTDSEGVYQSGSMKVNAPDKQTLEINLTQPFHSSLEMLAYTSFAAVPKGIVGDVQGESGQMPYKQFANNPVGAGPFQFEKWQSGTEAEVSRFDNYHGGKASIAGVHWQIIEKDQPRYNYAMNKNADVFNIPTAQYDPSKVNIQRGPDDEGRKFGTYGSLRNGDTAQYFSVPEISTFYIGFNMAEVPKPVRQAFAYVANQQQLVDQVFKGRGEASYHLTPPSIYPGGAKAYQQHAKQNYPYGYNETDLEGARKVMEDAGYNQNNTYTVQWTQYESDTWLELGKLFRDQLASAHVDMQIEQADFSTLLERGRSGKLEVYTLGWIADWPAPDNFLQLLNPPQTDTSASDPISYLNWTQQNGSAAQQATQAYKKVSNNQAPTKQAENTRDDAYIQIEEANWEDVGFLNLYHSLGERMWYDWVDIEPYGGMGGSRQMYNDVKIGQRQ